jgi:hypothetical protein
MGRVGALIVVGSFELDFGLEECEVNLGIRDTGRVLVDRGVKAADDRGFKTMLLLLLFSFVPPPPVFAFDDFLLEMSPKARRGRLPRGVLDLEVEDDAPADLDEGCRIFSFCADKTPRGRLRL